MKEELLKLNRNEYVAVAVGRIASNQDNVARNLKTNNPIGKAVLVDHYLFD